MLGGLELGSLRHLVENISLMGGLDPFTPERLEPPPLTNTLPTTRVERLPIPIDPILLEGIGQGSGPSLADLGRGRPGHLSLTLPRDRAQPPLARALVLGIVAARKLLNW